MDIFKRLTHDHHDHRALADALANAKAPAQRRALFDQLRTDVVAHANAEEQTFYAALLAMPDVQETARHSIIEHEELEELFEAADAAGPDSDAWPEAIEALVDRLKHHMHEEEDDVFPIAREALSDTEAISMVQAFEERKDGELPPPEPAAFFDGSGPRRANPDA